ncbi:hypothetical protein B4134_2909 [Bacillus safensis]|nr:hypothetical protein B4134_2909 [Bacillus safensis]
MKQLKMNDLTPGENLEVYVSKDVGTILVEQLKYLYKKGVLKSRIKEKIVLWNIN